MNAASPGTQADQATLRLLDLVEQHVGLSRDAGRVTRIVQAMPAAERHALATRLDGRTWRDPAWQAFLARLLVHETYLFRDWPQLDHLGQAGLADRLAAAGEGRRSLLLWSAGCASGEEAYSLAALTLFAMLRGGMATQAGGLVTPKPGWHLEVVGTDLSEAAIAIAGRGRYPTTGLSPFRALIPAFAPFFPPAEAGSRQVRPDLRASVRFGLANLLDDAAPVRHADVVVCRNVLVYLTQPARRRALSQLAGAVIPGGFLLLGPTDPAPDSAAFEAIWSAGPVIYRRR